MKANERMNDILHEALERLGSPSAEDLDAARERIRQNLRSTNPDDIARLSLPDTTPASLRPLRQPFLTAGAVVIICAALTATMGWIVSGRSPAASVSEVAVEPPRSGSAPPRVSQADAGEALRPKQPSEAPAAPPPSGIGSLRARAIKRPEPKREVEEAKSPEPAFTDVIPIVPGAVPPIEPVPVQPDADPGRAVLDRVCTVCHSLRGIEKHSYSTPDAYKDLISDMVSRGAVVSDEEMATIVEYLYKTYGQK